ncbi:peptidoglycan bridge formation glycyltransferase FemA/FemB family protein, partial [bacterium]|nr:peptidoglycan bridge formation glycyltransferase FemA/FemB family protein [bacterium]
MKCSLAEWNEFLSHSPNAHILQSGAWGELKSRFGWQPVRVINDNVGAQILFRRLPAGLSIGYIAKGPVGGSLEPLLPEIDEISRAFHAIFLKVEPDRWQTSPDDSIDQLNANWVSSKPIQPQRTVMVSLEGSEEEILARMKQKTRYNIRLAAKKDVLVTLEPDLDRFHAMLKITGARDHFAVHSLEYYKTAYDLFHPSGNCEVFTASFEESPLASLMVFARGNTAWYMYGASTDEERNRMPTYLLQWQAMLWAKAKGCTQYDLWGIPDLDE